MINAFGSKAVTYSDNSESVSLAYPCLLITVMKKRVVFILFTSFFTFGAKSQISDSVRMLQSIEIRADKLFIFLPGTKVERIDSATLAIRQSNNLAELLAAGMPVSLRSYGPGGVATLSMRGTNSSQSGVFWNGINLNQPNIGMADLTRVPAFVFNEIALQSGGGSSILGNGILGGSLQLKSSTKFSSPLSTQINLNTGSNHSFSGGFKLSVGKKKIGYFGAFYANYNRNDFNYTDLYGIRKKLEHALVRKVATLHQVEYKINNKQSLSAGFWLETTNRQVPPTMVMQSSDQEQSDRALRSFMQWNSTTGQRYMGVKLVFIDETEHFVSPTAYIDVKYYIKSTQFESEYKRIVKRLVTIGFSVSAKMIEADVPYYDKSESQPEANLAASVAFHTKNGKYKSSLNLIQEFVKGYEVPFCPSFNSEYNISQKLTATLILSRNFRVPTLNDRFWIPGGNRDLKPENSLNQEIGIRFKSGDTKAIPYSISLSIYNMLINNLIQWTPGSGGIWSAQNVQEIWSRGFEGSVKASWKSGLYKGFVNLGYNFAPSTYLKSSSPQQNLLGKQLIYAPVHKGLLALQVSRGSFYLLLSNTLTGKRYVVSDNSQSLPLYTLSDVNFGRTFIVYRTNFSLQLDISNIFNTQYQSAQYYPESGRTYMLNLILKH